MNTYSTRLNLIRHLPDDCVIAEIGVMNGDFSQQILDNANVSKLHLVDSWMQKVGNYALDPANVDQGGQDERYRNVKERFLGNHKVSIHRCESVQFAMLLGICKEKVDMAYIDADHSQEAVLDDLYAYSPLIEKGGCIMCHDYVDNENSRSYGFGVVAAVEQFCKERQWVVDAVTTEEWPTCRLIRL